MKQVTIAQKNVEIPVLLKYISKLWRTHERQLFTSKINLIETLT